MSDKLVIKNMKFFFSNRCYNGGNKHNFHPRYEEEDNGRIFGTIQYYNVLDLRKMFLLKKYVKDVCVWCGKEIKK